MGIPFFSKPELAEAILRDFQPLSGAQTYVLTDGWHPLQDLLNLCEERGLHPISAVKSNRKFKAAGHDLQVQQWVHSLPKRAFDFVTVDAAYYYIRAQKGLGIG